MHIKIFIILILTSYYLLLNMIYLVIKYTKVIILEYRLGYSFNKNIVRCYVIYMWYTPITTIVVHIYMCFTTNYVVLFFIYYAVHKNNKY